MDKAMIEIEKLKEEIKLLNEEKNKNLEEQNKLKYDLSIYNHVSSEKKYFMKELKGLKIKKAMLYLIYGIVVALLPLSFIASIIVSNPIIEVGLGLLGAGSVIINVFPKYGIVNSAIDHVQSDINDIKEKFEKAEEVGKFKENYVAQIFDLEVKNNEINACINEKNNRIDKLEALRKEVIEEFSPLLEQKIDTGYEKFIIEDTKAKTKIKK